MTCEYPINRFINPTPVYKSAIHVAIHLFNKKYEGRQMDRQAVP
jgi:hypothetical protein